MVCFPSVGPGVSAIILPFEMAVSPLSATTEMSKVALYAGSSKDGKARRASVASNCVTAYLRPLALLSQTNEVESQNDDRQQESDFFHWVPFDELACFCWIRTGS